MQFSANGSNGRLSCSWTEKTAVAFALLQGTAWTAVWRAGSREAITKSAMNWANRRTSRDRVSTIPTDRCALLRPGLWRDGR